MLIGRTKPFVRKPKAAIESGRGLPNVADGAAQQGIAEFGLWIADWGAPAGWGRGEWAAHMHACQAKSKYTTYRVKATTHMPTTMVTHSVSEVRSTSRRSGVLIVR